MRPYLAVPMWLLFVCTGCSATVDRADPPAPSPARAPEEPTLPGDAGTVVRVVDGDTIHVLVAGRRLKVRLIGVDTPETVHPTVGVQCYGPQASAYLKRMLDGKRVRLVYDVDPLDRYGRTLAYVYLDQLFVNLDLVEQGYATVLTVPPNVAHVDELLAAQRRAREASRGFWGSCP